MGGRRSFDSVTLRGFATYGTDFEFRSEVPAGEFELEPTYCAPEYLALVV